jgi:hypothetical protein
MTAEGTVWTHTCSCCTTLWIATAWSAGVRVWPAVLEWSTDVYNPRFPPLTTNMGARHGYDDDGASSQSCHWVNLVLKDMQGRSTKLWQLRYNYLVALLTAPSKKTIARVIPIYICICIYST